MLTPLAYGLAIVLDLFILFSTVKILLLGRGGR